MLAKLTSNVPAVKPARIIGTLHDRDRSGSSRRDGRKVRSAGTRTAPCATRGVPATTWEETMGIFASRSSWALGLLVTACALCAAAPAAHAFNPEVEAKNYSKGKEREAIYNTPEYQAQLAEVSTQNEKAAAEMQAADPEREFMASLCARGDNGCPGDVRLYRWQANGGLVKKVLFTARSGATISGHVWATKAGPAKRPGIVITNGSVQAPEQLYWYAAQALAKDGYVVLTFDPQGQGQSDEHGQAPDQEEGFPAQSDGRPFFAGTEDALNFFLSTAKHPYEPVPSCNTGTSHAPTHNQRV